MKGDGIGRRCKRGAEKEGDRKEWGCGRGCERELNMKGDVTGKRKEGKECRGG